MHFNSFSFWVLFPIIFAIYWLVPSRFQGVKKWVLIIISYLLYMNWQPAYAIVLFGIIIVTYVGGRKLEAGNDLEKRKMLCWIFTTLTLIPLLVFKYYNFFNKAGTQILEFIGIHFALPGLNWAIPVGISFFTFQALGYLWDVYYGKIKAETDFSDYVLFCSFFPQIASGPISKYTELMPQIKSPHPFRYEQGCQGLQILLWGMFLKVVVADRLGLYVDTVYNNYEHFSGINCFLASVFYTIQIYGDFAGYSLMAVGIGKILGFDLVYNFQRPYFADSVTNFWRRWHISLTRWLTNYVYIPMGGNRCSKIRQYWNIMVTFLVSGLWHGANWTFIVWGGLHGALQIIEKMLGLDPKGRYGKPSIYIKPLRILTTFLFVNFAWIFFRMPTIADAWAVITRIFTDTTSQSILTKAGNSDKLFMLIGIITMLAYEIRTEYLLDKLKWLNIPIIRWVIYTVLFCMIITIGVLDASSFIYVSF